MYYAIIVTLDVSIGSDHSGRNPTHQTQRNLKYPCSTGDLYPFKTLGSYETQIGHTLLTYGQLMKNTKPNIAGKLCPSNTYQ